MADSGNEKIARGKIEFWRNEVIGRTSSSTIFKGTFEGRIDVAVKRISLDSAELAVNEIDVLLVKADHINVVRYYCRGQDGDFCYIAMELCACNLEEYVEKKGNYRPDLPKTPDEEILRGVAEGLSHIHKIDIIHRDIKPRNILLFVRGDKVVAKISDFSLSRIIPDHQADGANISARTDLFKAPELLPMPFSWQCDVYTFGLVIFYVLSKGKHLFNNNPSLIIKGKPVNLEELKGQPAALSLIKWLTASNQEERPRMIEVLYHPFFWNDEKKPSFIKEVYQITQDKQNAFLKEVIEEDSHHVICSSPEKCGNQRTPPDPAACADWSCSLTPIVRAHFLRNKVNIKSCAELVRVIRNKLTHFYNLKKAMKAEYGGNIEEFRRYWMERFPFLVVHLWEKVEITHLTALLGGYYASESVRRKNLETTLQQQQQQTVSPPILEFTSQYLNNFETVKPLGDGGFGVVFQVRHRLDGRHYAVKIIPLPSSDEAREKFKREVRVLAELNHEHIVRYHNSWVESPPPGWKEQGHQQWMDSENFTGLTFNDKSKMCLYIQMELCQKDSMREWLEKNKHRDLVEVVRMFSQIVQAVEYVHLKNLIHRDLKPSNIFLGSDGRIKIGDFGLVTAVTEDPGRSRSLENPDGTSAYTPLHRHSDTVGTQLYMSPEQIENKPYNHKADIYSLGLIFFELLWPLRTRTEHRNTLIQLESLEFPQGFAEEHKQEHELLKKMLSSNPDERPTASEVLRSPPLADYQDDRSTTLRST